MSLRFSQLKQKARREKEKKGGGAYAKYGWWTSKNQRLSERTQFNDGDASSTV